MTESEHRCVACPVLRPNAEPRTYERPHCCPGCRSRLASLLGDLLDAYAQLELQRHGGAGAKVSGSRTPPLPVALDPLDLSMPSRLHTVHDEHGDQDGYPSVASVLDSWARDWQSYHWALLPHPDVSSLVGWLRERLEWACDHHPAVDDFADELDSLVKVVRSVAGLNRPRAELKWGVPCRECERVSLYYWPGSDYIECGSCPALLTPAEFNRWTALISAPEWRDWVEAVVAPQRESVA